MSNNTELENMKNAWQSLSNADLKKDIDKDAIEKMMRSKSKSELNKLIVTFIIELLASIPLVIIMMISMHKMTPSTGHAWVYDVFMVGVAIFLLLPLRHFFRIGKFRDQSTMTYLTKLTSVFDQVIKTVINFSRIFLVVAFPVALISVGADIHEDWKSLVIMMLIYVPFYIGLLFLIKLYYRYFYGRRMQRLKEYLQELRKEDNDEDDFDEQISILDEPIGKGNSYKLIVFCSVLVALILIAGIILYLCGDEKGVGYYIGYGIGYGVRIIQDWLVS